MVFEDLARDQHQDFHELLARTIGRKRGHDATREMESVEQSYFAWFMGALDKLLGRASFVPTVPTESSETKTEEVHEPGHKFLLHLTRVTINQDTLSTLSDGAFRCVVSTLQQMAPVREDKSSSFNCIPCLLLMRCGPVASVHCFSQMPPETDE
ncbi:hypothetical protein M427DRAFT_477697 [Gonapodya prolifera JEL478]|uniref:Uncharacterized protein n=1 Tax=Gonapodya prolifera (strain JEL478) TaxID=1344416 RepID=A0A139A162_GONPJ|nr:hypothetical protein M427DRAFT_477697 [Gonapodya prolifera JEL478]|eukprot:KXS10517.1 hypothetical protein M427DRAFT_477697 [Gonapodya prolifera JEL478]